MQPTYEKTASIQYTEHHLPLLNKSINQGMSFIIKQWPTTTLLCQSFLKNGLRKPTFLCKIDMEKPSIGASWYLQ